MPVGTRLFQRKEKTDYLVVPQLQNSTCVWTVSRCFSSYSRVTRQFCIVWSSFCFFKPHFESFYLLKILQCHSRDDLSHLPTCRLQWHTEVSWGSGQATRLALPGSKFTALKKVLATFLGLFGTSLQSAPGTCPRPIAYASAEQKTVLFSTLLRLRPNIFGNTIPQYPLQLLLAAHLRLQILHLEYMRNIDAFLVIFITKTAKNANLVYFAKQLEHWVCGQNIAAGSHVWQLCHTVGSMVKQWRSAEKKGSTKTKVRTSYSQHKPDYFCLEFHMHRPPSQAAEITAWP